MRGGAHAALLLARADSRSTLVARFFQSFQAFRLEGLLVNLCKRRKHLIFNMNSVTTRRSYVQSIFTRFRKRLTDVANIRRSETPDARRFLLCRR